MSVIYLIRHGQANIGSFNYDNLSTTGKQQAEILGRSFRKRLDEAHLIRHGSMMRHRQTVEHFKSKFRTTASIREDDGWNEYDHMDIIRTLRPAYNNKWIMLADMVRKFNPARDFELMFDEAMARWLSGSYDEEYAESWPAFKRRTMDTLQSLVGGMNDRQSALVITSGGVISSILQQLYQLPDQYFMQFNKKIVNCSVTKLVHSKRGLFVSTINDHSALEHNSDLVTYV